ncbi:MAG: hypothetical protein JXB49_23995 [Bacteroidales bacterium]|nr:hypothetical protein [Bacteroidales bacterium]
MKEFVAKILEVISDYRNDSGINIDERHILNWVGQFAKEDRAFILNEILHIMPQSYLSKQNAIELLDDSFEYLSKHYQYKNVLDFLSHSTVLDCQPQGKSQKALLAFFDSISKKKYNKGINEYGDKGVKHWIYFDDVIASGGTFFNNITLLIEEYGIEKYLKEGLNILAVFFFQHSWGLANIKYRFLQKFGRQFVDTIDFYHSKGRVIDNNPRINYYNPSPKLNNVFPLKIGDVRRYDEYLESLSGTYQSQFAYRLENTPATEEFYTSKENRIRYETILLNKGLDILDNCMTNSPPVRPLGLTPPGYKTLGTGSHAFTWRNVSNTCPLVFWWEKNNWIPLFSVQNRGT